MWRRVRNCIFQEHFTGVLVPKGDEKLTGFSGLHKSIFHPLIDSRLEGKISLYSGQRQEALLKALTTPPPLPSEDSHCNLESSGDRHMEPDDSDANVKDGEARRHWGCHLG